MTVSGDRGASWVAWHTTEARGSVAVRTGELVAAREFAPQGRHAPALLAMILELVRSVDLPLAAIGGVVVSTGPGSFTGIRVGLATAQGLAAARDWRVCTCDSLLARAAACGPGIDRIAIVQDARRGEVYASRYAWRAGGPRQEVAPFCAAPAAAVLALGSGLLEGDPLGLAGTGAELVRAPLERGGVRVEPRDIRVPVAQALLELQAAGRCSSSGLSSLEPFYLRKSDAEVRRQNNS